MPIFPSQEEWMNCQRNWLYLESIFNAPDIQRQLPAEAKMFLQVDKSWKEIMRKVNRLPNALRAATQPGIKQKLQDKQKDIAVIQHLYHPCESNNMGCTQPLSLVSTDDQE